MVLWKLARTAGESFNLDFYVGAAGYAALAAELASLA
jgi:hypothetical protein